MNMTPDDLQALLARAGPAQYASGRRPGTSWGGSRRKLTAMSTREIQKKMISDLQGLDNPGRGQDGVLGDHGEQAKDKLPQIQRRGRINHLL